ncbi:MAG: hypothetical protein AB7S83_03035 [Candidatus Methanomethylophilaceae archaeon]
MKNERMDTTVLGLIFIALGALTSSLVSLILYLVGVDAYGLTEDDMYVLMMICAVFILFAAIGAYINNSHFGAVFFALMAATFFFNGYTTGYLYTNISLAVMLIILLIWAFADKKPMMLNMLILTAALTLLFTGMLNVEWLSNNQPTIWDFLSGLAGIFTFAIAVYLAGSSVKDGLKVFRGEKGEE